MGVVIHVNDIGKRPPSRGHSVCWAGRKVVYFRNLRNIHVAVPCWMRVGETRMEGSAEPQLWRGLVLIQATSRHYKLL